MTIGVWMQLALMRGGTVAETWSCQRRLQWPLLINFILSQVSLALRTKLSSKRAALAQTESLSQNPGLDDKSENNLGMEMFLL